MCDINGIISKDSENLNWMQKEMAKVTNLKNASGTLADALKGADILSVFPLPASSQKTWLLL